MNKYVAIFVLFAVFAAASAQIISYSAPLIGGGHYAAAPIAYTAPLTAAPLTASYATPLAASYAAPLTTAWTSHYGAAPLAYAAWKK